MMKRRISLITVRTGVLTLLLMSPFTGAAQHLEFAVHADPVISWIGSNEKIYTSEGARAGFDIGLDLFHYFADNYAISSGISIMSAGGRQSVSEDYTLVFNSFPRPVPAGDEIRYNLKYINIPLGVRLETDPVGFFVYYTDMGFDIRMLLKSTIDLPTLGISGENGRKQVFGMNAGWHIGGGVEYKLPIDASLIAGLIYAQDFFDVTKDLKNVNQPPDRSALRMVRIRLGLKF